MLLIMLAIPAAAVAMPYGQGDYTQSAYGASTSMTAPADGQAGMPSMAETANTSLFPLGGIAIVILGIIFVVGMALVVMRHKASANDGPQVHK